MSADSVYHQFGIRGYEHSQMDRSALSSFKSLLDGGFCQGNCVSRRVKGGPRHENDPEVVAETRPQPHGVQDGTRVGTHGQEMVSDRRPVRDPRSLAGGRTTSRRSAALLRGDRVGAEDRLAMERFTETFSLASHLLAAARRVVRTRLAREGVAKIAAATRRAGTTETRRSVRGRHVCESKKGGEAIGLAKRGKGSKIMLLVDGHGTPLSVLAASASLGETSLLEPLLDQGLSPREPARLTYDRALDSDIHRERLRRRGIELACPHRKNRTRVKKQDGRSLRRFARRWKIERTNSWLHNFRRIGVRHERSLLMFTGFAQLACLLIVLRRF
jgi:transposase